MVVSGDHEALGHHMLRVVQDDTLRCSQHSSDRVF